MTSTMGLRTCVHVVTGLTLLSVACSSSKINLHGTVQTTSGSTCSEVQGSPEDLDGRQLTARDEAGAVVGTTDLEYSDRSDGDQGGCIVEATYRVDVPGADFYELEISGVPGSTDPISFDELEANGYRYDFSVN